MSLGLLLLTGLVAVGLAFGFWRSLRRGLAPLDRGSRELGEGNFTHRIDVATQDELGELAGTFNSMAENLEGTHQRLDEARTVAEQANRTRASSSRA